MVGKANNKVGDKSVIDVSNESESAAKHANNGIAATRDRDANTGRYARENSDPQSPPCQASRGPKSPIEKKINMHRRTPARGFALPSHVIDHFRICAARERMERQQNRASLAQQNVEEGADQLQHNVSQTSP